MLRARGLACAMVIAPSVGPVARRRWRGVTGRAREARCRRRRSRAAPSQSSAVPSSSAAARRAAIPSPADLAPPRHRPRVERDRVHQGSQDAAGHLDAVGRRQDREPLSDEVMSRLLEPDRGQVRRRRVRTGQGEELHASRSVHSGASECIGSPSISSPCRLRTGTAACWASGCPAGRSSASGSSRMRT